jgi:hypothetical protein
MKKKDLIRKITSRKFWVTVTNFVSMMMVFLGKPESDATQVASLIIAGASVIAYVIAEGWSDASNTNGGQSNND